MTADRPLRILAWVHLYPPDHCAGAEMMLHEILLGLKRLGHSVSVYLDSSSVDEWEGVRIYTSETADPSSLIDNHDILFTHLDRTRTVIATNSGRLPIVHLIHNDKQLKFHRVRPQDAALVVANSAWIRDAINWPGPTMVLPPPVDPKRYRTTPGDAITLINMGENKGARLFWTLTRIMPERKFIAVKGGYSEQIVANKVPPHVEVIEHTPDIRSVYAKTRLLLMPSAYESWGRVGIEAAASGIPTIAHPTPGLLESLGDAGTFADRGDIADWVEAIRALDDPELYAEKSAASLARSAELEPSAMIAELSRLLQEMPRRERLGRLDDPAGD
jgi:glycosyltransferase involved in cell wall biosynthesis